MAIKGKIFYGWFVVLGAFLVTTAVMGLHYNLIGLYYPYLSEHFGFSNSALGLYFMTVTGLSTTITSIFIGKIYSRITLRFGMCIAGIFTGFVYIGYSMASSPIHFMALSFILGICVGIGTVSAFSMLANKWFIHKRGTAISIIAAGTGLAGFFFSPILSAIIETSGFQKALFIEGLIILALTAIGTFFIRSSPASMGLKPLTAENAQSVENEKNVVQTEELRSINVGEALKTLPFYILTLTLFIMSGLIITYISQYPSYLRSLNFSASKVALIISGLGVSLTVCKISYGVLVDKLGILRANYLMFISWVIATFSLIFADTSIVFVILFIIFSGSLAAMTSVAIPLWTSSMFGDKYFPSIIGTISAFVGIGSMLAPIVLGYFIDATSYKTLFSISIGFMIILGVLMTFALKLAFKIRQNPVV